MRETILVNGEERDWTPNLTVGVLLESLSLNPDRVAVELNGDILTDSVNERTLRAGDALELVHFVGGG